jgi:hypothetical protein
VLGERIKGSVLPLFDLNPQLIAVDPERFYRSGEKISKKFEARNSKYETNPKSEFPMFKIRDVLKVYQ